MTRKGTKKTVTTRKDGVAVKRLTLVLPEDLADALAHRAIDEKRDMSSITADALKAYLHKPVR